MFDHPIEQKQVELLGYGMVSARMVCFLEDGSFQSRDLAKNKRLIEMATEFLQLAKNGMKIVNNFPDSIGHIFDEDAGISEYRHYLAVRGEDADQDLSRYLRTIRHLDRASKKIIRELSDFFLTISKYFLVCAQRLDYYDME